MNSLTIAYTSLNSVSINQNLSPKIQIALSAIGPNGLSAYQVAQTNGFSGTETEWLASLKGAKGDAGEKGEKGEKGDTGTNGTSSAALIASALIFG